MDLHLTPRTSYATFNQRYLLWSISSPPSYKWHCTPCPSTTPLPTVVLPTQTPVSTTGALPVAQPPSWTWPVPVTPSATEPRLLPPWAPTWRGPPRGLEIAPTLHLNLSSHYRPNIYWDVTKYPLREARSGQYPSHPVNWDAPAFWAGSDEVLQVDILIRGYAFQQLDSLGPIVLRRRASDPKFTVKHVLEKIYDYFHTPLTQRELDTLYSSPSTFDWGLPLYSVWQNRTRCGPLLRCDLLGPYRLFEGIHPNATLDYSHFRVTLSFLLDPSWQYIYG
ncbi:hypothetical protein Moror_5748 [Moniliophthora roreri MCA 2997]|uniref:DUF6699 domain-containing protein n=2 Tax=Moniliophthora roreri TaxID=221103 RepID=V2WKE2_MONRO|nr:hypothetical protein Moror_5748 [Moniliophthora roreri MCA 2997]